MPRRPGTPKTGGRKSGVKNRAQRADKLALAELAQGHGESAISALASVMLDEGQPAAARVSAASALLDRGYGKPMQAVELAGLNGGPIQVQRVRRVIVDASNPDADA